MSPAAQWRLLAAIAGLCLGCDLIVAAVADDARTIVQSERSFRPAEVTIGRGETLSFANRDEFIHQIYVDANGLKFDSAEQPPGEIVQVRFPGAGDYPVRCHIHPKMKLLVQVK